MSGEASHASSPWADALLAAALFAVDPIDLGGISLRSAADPVRERWLAELRALFPATLRVRRVPHGVSEGRLLGELDLAATLSAGRPVVARGILAEADGALLLLAMAERLTATAATHLCRALDWHEIALERDGITERYPSRVGLVALDEGTTPDERPPAALLERLAFHVDLGPVGRSPLTVAPYRRDELAAARARLPGVAIPDGLLASLVGTAQVLGIGSLRVVSLAVRVARAAAALGGRLVVDEPDAVVAGRLVLAPRATALPAAEPPLPDEPDSEPPDDAADPENGGEGDDEPREAPDGGQPPEDIVLAATAAAIPAGLLLALRQGHAQRARVPSVGRFGVIRPGGPRGRPAGVRRGEPRAGARLSVIATLRAAAPWQRLRRAARAGDGRRRLEVRREDFHVGRFKPRTETTTIFLVDASGSAALHRLAEAKGAVELLLADCYVRRDRVALIAFRGRGAELLLAPTRSLVRAKRSLAGLPGGGGTPFATGIDAAVLLAEAVQRRGGTPTLVILSDGRANIARDGAPGRARAAEDARAAARRARLAHITTLFVDTSPRPQPLAEQLARDMQARYLPLPHADARALSRAARAAAL